MLAVLWLREKTKFQRWEQNITRNEMIPGTSHLKTMLPSHRWCVKRVWGDNFGGARLWKAWQLALCYCRHNTVKVRHQLCTFCLANKSKHKISPSYFRILLMEVFAICSRWWMICNAYFSSAVAMDVSGRHGQPIWIFVERQVEKREKERGGEGQANAKGVIICDQQWWLWIFSQLIKPLNIYPAKCYINLADKLIQNNFLSLKMVEEIDLTSQLPNHIWRASHPDTTLDTIRK